MRTLPAPALLSRKTVVFAALCGLWVAKDYASAGGGAAMWPSAAAGAFDTDLWVSIMLSCALSGCLAQLAQARAQRAVSPQEAQLSYTLTPVATAAIGAATLGENLNSGEVLGAALIMAAAGYQAMGSGASPDAEA